MQAFHLAIPSTDLERSRKFYGDVLGLKECRAAFNWVDYDFFGHQLSIHLVLQNPGRIESTGIDGDQVPALHFGMVLTKGYWENLRDRLKNGGTEFIIGPKLRFPGTEAEQGTFFIKDPTGNYLEFKYFTNPGEEVWF